jgi:short-subunit dehydrogenase
MLQGKLSTLERIRSVQRLEVLVELLAASDGGLRVKVLIIGATSAIAHETAKCFAADAAELCLLGRDVDRLQANANDLKARGAKRVDTISANLSVLTDHQRLISDAMLALGGLDAALIAHGTLGDQGASQADIDETLRQFTTNATSYISLMTILGNHMEAQRRGCIAVISSVAGERGRGSNYVYGSAKSAVTQFASGLRARLAKSGVAVVTVKPGVVDTPMTAGIRKGPLTAKPGAVGRRIYEAMLKGDDVVYTPWFWSPIMLVVRSIPESVFKRTKM